MKEGDRNTRFFHRMTNSHRRRNSFKKIRIEGKWLEEDFEIKKGMVEAFQCLLTTPYGGCPSLLELPFNVIEAEDVAKQ